MFELEDAESPGELCPDPSCGGSLDEDGQCVECGALADLREPEKEPPPAAEGAQGRSEASSAGAADSGQRAAGADAEIEFAHRRLCPDGACVGVIGSDGRCKECGLIDDEVLKDPRLRGLKSESPQLDEDEDEAEEGDEDAAESVEKSSQDGTAKRDEELLAGDEPLEFQHRQLCPDGACIGVVGRDGICKECGMVA